MASTPDYSRLPFPELLAYLEGKTNLDTDSWRDGMGVVQDAAFTVARAKGQLLQEIREALDRAVNDGQGVDQFVQVFDAIASRWSAAWPLKGSTGWRGQLIYEQNLRQAYAAGRYRQMTEPEVLKRRPYWEWRHGGSFAPRPAHLAMDGRIFAADSFPMPPWGFGCQCQVFSLSKRDVGEDFEPEEYRQSDPVDWIDPATGQTRQVYLTPDPGFENSPGSSSASRRQEVLSAALEQMDPRIAEQVVQEIAQAS